MTSKFDILAGALKHVPNRADRFAMMVGEWDEAMWDHQKLHRSDPQAANTITSVLTNFLIDGSVTDLQNVWSPLRALSLDYDPNMTGALRPGILKHATAGGTAQTNPTNYESGNSTVAPITITPSEISVSWQVSNTDLNSGIRMADLVRINTANFANAVIDLAVGPITTANFNGTTALGSPSLVSIATAFGYNELSILQAALKKSPIKNIILDGAYLARVANQPGYYQEAGTLGGNAGGWKIFGWDGVYNNTRWNGAQANVQGFACNPQAIGGLFGLPLLPAVIPGNILQTEIQTVPGLAAKVLAEAWFNPATRTLWNSLRCVCGFTAVDLSAGYLITSS